MCAYVCIMQALSARSFILTLKKEKKKESNKKTSTFLWAIIKKVKRVYTQTPEIKIIFFFLNSTYSKSNKNKHQNK